MAPGLSPEDYQRASDLFNELHDVPDGDLSAAVEAKCQGNAAVRSEVVRLLKADRRAGAFLQKSALQDAARLLQTRVPETIAHYRILSKLGEGGMGEVWRAHDSKLDREVAIKILPEAFAASPDRMARFTREAQVLASLSHPNIAMIYGVEERALIIELVEGPTLAERIASGPIPWEEAAEIACHIADALEAAHEKGVVHRDLKPANIKIGPEGRVKVLDFGLSKPMSKPQVAGDPSSPTAMLEGSMAGMILGTAAYMAPEQAKGKVVDRRADIWAFGVVCVEMLTGRSPFQRESVPETLAAVLKGDVDLERVPEPARTMIDRCLRMDPRRRWQSIGDARIAIEEAQAGRPVQVAVPVPLSAGESSPRWTVWIAASLLALVVIAAGAIAVRHSGERPAPRQVVRLRFDFPDGVTLPPVSVPAFSPDGTRVAAIAISGSKTELWLRSLDSLASVPLAGTEGVTRGPIFSPDSHSLAFTRGSSIWRLNLGSGSTQLLCALCGVPPDALAPLERQAQPDAWSRDGIILFTEGSVIKQVPAAGGVATPVTALAAGETIHFGASFLPDGRHFLYNALSGFSPGAVNVGVIGDIKFRKQIMRQTDRAAYVPPGWLLFSRAGVLLAQPIDPEKLELTGQSTPVTEPVAGLPFLPGPAFSFLPGYAYSVSETGSLAWRRGARGVTSMELTWFDRTGKKLGSVGEPGEITNPVLSPDGRRVLITVRDRATRTRDLWILDLARGTNSRLTFDPAEDHNPVWSPDGVYVIFSSNRKGHHDIYRKRSDGSGVDEELLVSQVDKGVDSVSPDGKSVLYNVQGPSGRVSTLWSVPITGDRKPTPAVTGPFLANFGQFSPNGRWLAYTATESGRNQVFVRSAPGSGLSAAKWQVSNGTMPQWRSDGTEIFFLDGEKLMSAPVRSDGNSFQSGAPIQLFTAPLGISFRNHFTVSADGQRFLFAAPEDSGASHGINVLLNWPGLLKKN